jgi:hypothetical protein
MSVFERFAPKSEETISVKCEKRKYNFDDSNNIKTCA